MVKRIMWIKNITGDAKIDLMIFGQYANVSKYHVLRPLEFSLSQVSDKIVMVIC